MPMSFAIVCEASADRATACELADRVFCREVDWITEEVLNDYRCWRGLEPNEPHLTWREAADLVSARTSKLTDTLAACPVLPMRMPLDVPCFSSDPVLAPQMPSF